MKNYIFKSARLGFRNWSATDLEDMAAINADPDVMRFFPNIQTKAQTADFITRMQTEFAEKRYCYFAAEELTTGELIGFIGLHEQTFEAAFTPCVDIGWRLKKAAWHKGYATEGALQCLTYGFQETGLKNIVAMAPEINLPSINVMIKAGMVKTGTFQHPLLGHDERLKMCVLYEMNNPNQ